MKTPFIRIVSEKRIFRLIGVPSIFDNRWGLYLFILPDSISQASQSECASVLTVASIVSILCNYPLLLKRILIHSNLDLGGQIL